jgi:ubiquinone biosynthesis protein
LQKLENDNFAFNIQLKGFEQFEKRNDKIFSRLSLSIVVLALCVIIAGIFISIGVRGQYVEEYASLSIKITKALLLDVGDLIIGLVISVIRSFFKR